MWGQGERKSISFLCDFLTIQNWQPRTVFPVHSVCTKDCCFPVAKLCPHELQQARLPCASLFPGVCSNSCSYLENSMERGAWQVTVHGVTRSQTQLGDSHTHTHTHVHWVNDTIQHLIPFFCPRSFPVSGSFPMSQLFTSGDQSIGASASASVLPMSIQLQEMVCAERQKSWVQGLVPLFTIHVPCNKSLNSLSLNFFVVTRDN